MSENKGIDYAAGVAPTQVLKIDGKEYELAPLKLKDLALIQKRAREVSLREAEENMAILRAAGDFLDAESRMKMVKDAMNIQANWVMYVVSADGITYAFHLRLKKQYPEMIEDVIGVKVTLNSITEAKEELFELLGIERFLPTEEDEGDASPSQKPSEEQPDE